MLFPLWLVIQVFTQDHLLILLLVYCLLHYVGVVLVINSFLAGVFCV